jgi:NAD(P)-dependent dehydrogenase (short-subunit alcohol dehydrogenase family)
MRILMTGGTQGIGLEAVQRLLAREDVALTIGLRGREPPAALRHPRIELLPLDLARLESVRAFCARASALPKFDALALNAGLQCVNGEMSADGYELTFAVNHLAHHLIAWTIAPTLARGGRIVFTASGTHDPDEKTGFPEPWPVDARRLARGDLDPDRDRNRMRAGRRAYATSKLCNVMSAREMARRLSGRRDDIAVAAFDPGFTPGTGLARGYPGPAGWIFRHVLPSLVRRTDRVSTPANSGRLLAELITSDRYAGSRGTYWAVRGEALLDVEPSVQARDGARCAQLWDDTSELLGLPPELRMAA